MIYRGRWVDPLALWGNYVELPRGASLDHEFLEKVQCPNPEHSTTKHHFQINMRKPIVHCFADCGISGHYEHAIQLVTGCDQEEARRIILKHSRMPMKGDLASITSSFIGRTIHQEDAIAKDERNFKAGAYTWLPRAPRDYLADRGIDGESIGKWQIGWDTESERLTIPAFDHRGVFRFLIRRRIDAGRAAKYLYSRDALKTSLLFGACSADMEQVRSWGLILTEGPLDPIRLHQVGFPVAMAILGTGISTAQVRLIDKFGPKRVYLMFDKDEAGVANIVKARQRIHKVPIFVCRFPAHRSDPAELTGKEAERILERAVPINEFFRKARVTRPIKEAAHG